MKTRPKAAHGHMGMTLDADNRVRAKRLMDLHQEPYRITVNQYAGLCLFDVLRLKGAVWYSPPVKQGGSAWTSRFGDQRKTCNYARVYLCVCVCVRVCVRACEDVMFSRLLFKVKGKA
jgi:hypothetical protein